jgi:sugar lactone lactonase YvrE
VADKAEFMFKTVAKNPNGLQAAKEGLWVLDQGTDRVSLQNWSDGKALREFPTKTDKGSGITFDGKDLWIASTYNRMLVKVSAQDGKTIKEMPSPGSGVVKWGPRSAHPRPTGAHGLEWRDGQLWVSNPPDHTIYVVNPEDGAVIRKFPAPGVRPHGIGWDPDGNLWVAESIYRTFYKMDRASGKILRAISLPLTEPKVDDLIIVPHGLTVHEKHIWWSCAETAQVYRVPLA